jgi:hypothetical protein
MHASIHFAAPHWKVPNRILACLGFPSNFFQHGLGIFFLVPSEESPAEPLELKDVKTGLVGFGMDMAGISG